MSQQRDEKGRPVEQRERDEKGRPVEHHDEKGEKYRRDPLAAVFLGLIIILAGTLWFLSTNEYIEEGKWWPWFLVGLGSIFIVERLIRYALPEYRRPMFGRILIGVILICIGIGFVYGLVTWWPLIVIAVGAAIIIYGISRGRRPRA